MTTRTNNRDATIREGVRLVLGGDRDRAGRDRFERRDLTARGRAIYQQIDPAWDTHAIYSEVARAVDAV